MRELWRIRARLPHLLLLLVLLFAELGLALAQTASEYQVKAAYLYNFAKFVEWPAADFASPTAPIRICVLNDNSFERELNQITKGKTVGGRPVTIVPVTTAEESHGCNILFINAAPDAKIRRILDVLRDTRVLTVGQEAGFVENGGIINFVMQDDRVQFQVNHRAANQAGLRISSRLLSVAKRVIE